MLKLEGVYSVVPTPFKQDLQVDHESLRRVVELFIGAGVNGLTALGVTSETSRLTESERAETLETILKVVNGRVPVVLEQRQKALKPASNTAGGRHQPAPLQ